MRNSKRRPTVVNGNGCYQQQRKRWEMQDTEVDRLRDSQSDFDPDAWVALVEQQRRIIARAAGVDPSKVRIHVGH